MSPKSRSNDPDTTTNRLKKTVANLEAAEFAAEFAEGKELAAIEAKNERRKESIKKLSDELIEQKKSQINGYL